MKTTIKSIVFGAVAAASGLAIADANIPEVTAIEVDQGMDLAVTIKYKLDVYPAVVTLDVKTNDTVSIGGEHVCNAKGAVWRKVTADDVDGFGWCTIVWHPEESWIADIGNGFKALDVKFDVTAWPLDNTPDYMVVDVSSAAKPNTQRYYPRVDFLPGSLLGQKGAVTNNAAYKTTMLVMRKIMAKDVTWTTGSVVGVETARQDNEEQTYQVTLTNNYYIGIFEVTQTQWGLIATNSAAVARYSVEGAMRPMEKVSFNEIHNTHSTSSTDSSVSADFLFNPSSDSFLGLLRLKTGIDFDLPSEAEWEFAARAGHGTGYWGDGSAIMNTALDGNLDKVGRYKGNNPGGDSTTATLSPAAGGTAIVGSYNPNDWGLYDMHGNVAEWCLDWYQVSSGIASLSGKVNVNYSDPSKCADGSNAYGNIRILRGGTYYEDADKARIAKRGGTTPTNRFWGGSHGFRVVCRAGLK